MLQSARRLRTTLVSVILVAHFANSLLPAMSLAQGGSAPNVQRGQEYYEQSRFDEAIGLLKGLVDRGALQGEDLQHARELLARSYVKKGYPAQGMEMFKVILRSNPLWRPDPIRVPPDETAVFEQALKEYTAESAGGTPSPPAEPGTPGQTSPTVPPPGSPIVPTEGTPKKKSKRVWYIVGGAVLLGGIVAAAAGGGGGGDSTPTPALAGFPGPPSP